MTKEIVDPAASQRTTDKQSPSPVELTAGDWSPLDNSLWDLLDETTHELTTPPQSNPNRLRDLSAGDWSPLDNSLWDLLDEDAEYDWGISSGVSGQRMEGEPQSVAEPSDVK